MTFPVLISQRAEVSGVYLRGGFALTKPALSAERSAARLGGSISAGRNRRSIEPPSPLDIQRLSHSIGFAWRGGSPRIWRASKPELARGARYLTYTLTSFANRLGLGVRRGIED